MLVGWFELLFSSSADGSGDIASSAAPLSKCEGTDASEGAGLGGWPFSRPERCESGVESDSELVVSRGGEDGSDFLDRFSSLLLFLAAAFSVGLVMTATFRNRVRL